MSRHSRKFWTRRRAGVALGSVLILIALSIAMLPHIGKIRTIVTGVKFTPDSKWDKEWEERQLKLMEEIDGAKKKNDPIVAAFTGKELEVPREVWEMEKRVWEAFMGAKTGLGRTPEGEMEQFRLRCSALIPLAKQSLVSAERYLLTDKYGFPSVKCYYEALVYLEVILSLAEEEQKAAVVKEEVALCKACFAGSGLRAAFENLEAKHKALFAKIIEQ